MKESFRAPEPRGAVRDASQEADSYVASFPERVATAVGFVLTGNILSRVLGFAGNVLTARVIGPAGFGMLGMVRSTLSLGSSFTGMGVGSTASRYIPQWRDSREEDLAQLLGLVCIVGVVGSVVAGGALVWLASALAHEVYSTPELVSLFVAAVPWIMARVVVTLAEKVLRGFEKFGVLAVISAVRGALAVTFLAAVLFLWRGTPLGAVLALGAVEVIVALILLGAAWDEGVNQRRGGVRWPDFGVVYEPLRQYAVPSYGFLLLQAPVSWFLLTRLARIENGSEFVGAVQATGSFRGAMSLLPAALATTLLPILSRLHSLASAEAFSQRLRRLVRILWFFALPAGVLAAAALPFLMEVVFGASFGVYASACAVLLIVTAWSIVNEVFDRTLAAVGKMWLSFALGLGYAVIAIGLTVLLVPRLELWGYVIAQFAAMAGYVIVQQEIVGRWIDYRAGDRWIAVGLAVTGGAASVVVSALAAPGHAFLGAMALGVIYTLLGWGLLLGSGERKFVRARIHSSIQWTWTRAGR